MKIPDLGLEDVLREVSSSWTPLLGYFSNISNSNFGVACKLALGCAAAVATFTTGSSYYFNARDSDTYDANVYMNNVENDLWAYNKMDSYSPTEQRHDLHLNLDSEILGSEVDEDFTFNLRTAPAGGDPDPDKDNSILNYINQKTPPTTKEPIDQEDLKIRKSINWKLFFNMLNCFGFLGFFISSKPFTPIMTILIFVLQLFSSYFRVIQKLLVILIPVARTVTLFDTIRFIVFNGISIASSIFINNEMVSYWSIMEIFSYILILAKFSEDSFFSKSKRFFSHYVFFMFIAMFYTYNSPEYTKTMIGRLLTYLSFLFSLFQLHLATSKSGENWIRSMFKGIFPYRKTDLETVSEAEHEEVDAEENDY